KTETTRIFELMSAAGQLSEELARLRERYQQAWKTYLAQEWDLAEASFRECLQIRPNDGPSRVFLERIQVFRRNPPGKDWDGVWQLIQKINMALQFSLGLISETQMKSARTC